MGIDALLANLDAMLFLTYLTFTGCCQPLKSKLNHLIYSSNFLFLGILTTLFLYSYSTPSFSTTYVVVFNLLKLGRVPGNYSSVDY